MDTELTIEELEGIRKKLVKKAIKMANEPDKYDVYNKGWIAGQISLLNKLLGHTCSRCGDPTTEPNILCRECQ